MKNRMAIFLPAGYISLLVMAMLACSLSTSVTPGGNPLGNNNSGQPVSLSKGLASLNSYRATITIKTKGPDPTDSSAIVYEAQRSQQQNARYTRTTSSQVKKGVESSGSNADEVYRIGNDQCTKSGDQWSWTSMPANEAEMMDLSLNVFDPTPIIDNPTFVANETVNNIPSKHYTFKVSGLGDKSGAKVTSNQGDYWLAVDGQYIVKYSLVVETVVDTKTSIAHMETFIEVKDINQPVSIAFPQACKDAATAKPLSPNQSPQTPTDIPAVIPTRAPTDVPAVIPTRAPTDVPAVIPTTVPNPTQDSTTGGFAGSWDTKYGDMTCTVVGENVNCTYTHNAGRVEAFLNPDGRSLEGSWFEAPTYKPPAHAGKMVWSLSADGNSFTGQWWYGPAGDGGMWTGARKTGSASTNSGSALFEDDFSTPNKTIWPEDSDENHFRGFSEGGKYGITILNPGKIAVAIPSVPLNAETLTDVVVEFTATIVDGWESDAGYYEVGCRRTGDGGYAVLFYNGYYAVEYENAKANISFLKSKWVKTTAIQQYDNRVKVSCIGSTITVLVNDQLLVQVSDPQARAKNGFVWLGVGSFDKPSPNGVKVLFDDFRESIP